MRRTKGDSPSPKPIETLYKGYRFRSRLEARWAVFFDTLGWKWEYEREGYDLDGVWYLPDFWLPDLKMWAEVKPEELSSAECNKAERLAHATGHPVLLLIGLPELKPYSAIATHKGGTTILDFPNLFTQAPRAEKAYAAARSARFERSGR